MVLDIRPILRGETKRIDIDYSLTPYGITGVSFGEAKVVGDVTDTGGCIELSLSASVSYTGECARCLEPVEGVFEMEFTRTVAEDCSLRTSCLESCPLKTILLSRSATWRISFSLSPIPHITNL